MSLSEGKLGGGYDLGQVLLVFILNEAQHKLCVGIILHLATEADWYDLNIDFTGCHSPNFSSVAHCLRCVKKIAKIQCYCNVLNFNQLKA